MRYLPVSGRMLTIVDDDDFSYLKEFNWKITAKTYPVAYVLRHKKQYPILLHRLVMGCTWSDAKRIDHVNGNTLDNRKSNLRFCSHSQNMSNRKKVAGCTSQYLGVYFASWRNLWTAQIKHNKKKVRLGYFTDEKEAALAYDHAARELHGEFARPNFPA